MQVQEHHSEQPRAFNASHTTKVSGEGVGQYSMANTEWANTTWANTTTRTQARTHAGSNNRTAHTRAAKRRGSCRVMSARSQPQQPAPTGFGAAWRAETQ